MEAIHMAKNGHLTGLRDMVAELTATMAGTVNPNPTATAL